MTVPSPGSHPCLSQRMPPQQHTVSWDALSEIDAANGHADPLLKPTSSFRARVMSAGRRAFGRKS